MSKTVDLQVEKSRALVKGLAKHLENGGSGVTPAEIGKMERDVDALIEGSAECERLRAELAPKVQHMNELMAQVKVIYADKKKMLKLRYPQEQWADYGVPDKR